MKIDGSGQRKTPRGLWIPRTREAEGTHRIQVIAWLSVLLAGLQHGTPAHRCLRDIPAWQRGSSGQSSARGPYPQVPQRHPRVAKESSIGSSARGPCLQVPQWHPRMAKRVFWQVFGTGALPTGTSVTSSRGKGVIYRVFGTATLPTDASVASSRGKEGFWTVFGTATLPTDVSVESSRTNCELVYRIVAILGFVKFTWHGPLLIIK